MTEVQMASATTEGLGPYSAVFDAEPWDYYEAVRARGDVVWCEEDGAWLLTSYAALKDLSLQDTENGWLDPYGMYDPEFPPMGLTREQWVEFLGGRSVLQAVDRETHERQHRWWFKAFSPKVLSQWGEQLVDPLIRETLEPVAQRGSAELASEFVQLLTPRIMAAVLGFPYDSEWQQRYSDTARRMLKMFGPTNPDVQESLDAGDELNAMIMEQVLARQPGVGHAPPAVAGTDFIRQLWAGGEELFGPGFEPVDVRGHAMQALLASMESVGGATRNGFYLLATNPELQDQVRDDDRAAHNFVEETLRLFGAVDWRTRRAKQDSSICGVPIKRNEMVWALIGCANRDPERYPDPYKVDLDRKAPRDHFGFLQGPHICAGQGLARFALKRFFQRTLERISDLRLDPDKEPPRYSGSFDRRWYPLNVRFSDR